MVKGYSQSSLYKDSYIYIFFQILTGTSVKNWNYLMVKKKDERHSGKKKKKKKKKKKLMPIKSLIIKIW